MLKSYFKQNRHTKNKLYNNSYAQTHKRFFNHTLISKSNSAYSKHSKNWIVMNRAWLLLDYRCHLCVFGWFLIYFWALSVSLSLSLPVCLPANLHISTLWSTFSLLFSWGHERTDGIKWSRGERGTRVSKSQTHTASMSAV